VGNLDGQLRARPAGPGRLYLCVNRGSEVFGADEDGLELLYRREATPEEDRALDAAARATVDALARRGLRAEIVSQRLNRRKIDLIPEPEWADPPKARIAELLEAVQQRLRDAGLAGLAEVVQLAEGEARAAGLRDPRVTSDAKHVEIGLTDKSDSVRWLQEQLAARGVGPGSVLVVGDEFGPLGGLPGSDSLLLLPDVTRVTAASVGAEPTGTPAEVLHLGGGPERFVELLEDQLERRRRGDLPELDPDPAWTIAVEGFDPQLERVHETLLALADTRIGTRGVPLYAHPAEEPGVFAAGVYEGEGAESQLVRLPDWTELPGRLPAPSGLRRRLDLRTALLFQSGPADSVQLSSLAQPRTVAMRVVASPRRLPPTRSNGRKAALSLAVSDRRRNGRLERVGVYRPDTREARAALREAVASGFERLLDAHREAWARRWQAADVVIEGDPELQLALRFALFHLIGSVPDSGEAAVGAR